MINKRWITLPVVYYSRPKTAFEAKGRLYTTGKVIQLLFIIGLYTLLAIYGYRWGKR